MTSNILTMHVPGISNVIDIFVYAIIAIIAIFAMLCLIRAIIGPKLADRVVAINMIGSMVIVAIALLSVRLENYLADICLIYAMISFLAVIVLSKLYTSTYKDFHEDSVYLYEKNEMQIDLPDGDVETGLDSDKEGK